MLNIDRSVLNGLGFDFEAALKKFTESKAQHAFTVNVPAPGAHPLVEAAWAEGGYKVVEPPPAVEPPPPRPDPFKAAARGRLNQLQGKTVGAQLDEFRAILAQVVEKLPG